MRSARQSFTGVLRTSVNSHLRHIILAFLVAPLAYLHRHPAVVLSFREFVSAASDEKLNFTPRRNRTTAAAVIAKSTAGHEFFRIHRCRNLRTPACRPLVPIDDWESAT